jgi:hypothetical protein
VNRRLKTHACIDEEYAAGIEDDREARPTLICDKIAINAVGKGMAIREHDLSSWEYTIPGKYTVEMMFPKGDISPELDRSG